MDITPVIEANAQVIRSYASGWFNVAGTVYDQAIAVFPDKTELWRLGRGEQGFSIGDFGIFQGRGIDILLVGCGSGGVFLPDLRRKLKANGISADFMDTGAACRTYNVLMAEGRRVAAALIPLLRVG